MRGWSRRRKVLTIGGVLVGLWLVAVAYLLLDARSSLRSGTDELRAVRRGATISSLVDPATSRRVERAQERFDHAAARLDNPFLMPLRVLPVVGRHLGAARDIAHGSQRGADIAASTLRRMDALVERPHRTGAERLELLAELAAVAKHSARDLAAIDVGSSDALVASLGDAVDELRDQRDDAARGARDLASVSTALGDVLDGPEPYLLLGANNGEMRAGSGMFLSAATLALNDGELDLGEVRPTAELILPAGSVPVSGDLARNWSWLDAGRDLRNMGLTADFPQSAPLAVANWAKVPGGARTAGVIVVDVDAIRSLLRVVGSVEIDGVRYTPDNVRGELLRQQYTRYPDDRAQRRDQLGQVAREIFERLQQGRWEVAALATELVDMVQGRHLLVWSSERSVQRAWRAVGADGHLTERSFAVSLLNRAGEKLDSWVDTEASLRFAAASGGRRRMTVTYVIRNRAPGSGPTYVVGPNIAGLEVGDHRGLVVANLPAGSTEISIDGGRRFLAGRDGPTETIGSEVTIRRGATATVTIRALLPPGITGITIEPSARIQHTDWIVSGRRFERDRRRTVPVRGVPDADRDGE